MAAAQAGNFSALPVCRVDFFAWKILWALVKGPVHASPYDFFKAVVVLSVLNIPGKTATGKCRAIWATSVAWAGCCSRRNPRCPSGKSYVPPAAPLHTLQGRPAQRRNKISHRVRSSRLGSRPRRRARMGRGGRRRCSWCCLLSSLVKPMYWRPLVAIWMQFWLWRTRRCGSMSWISDGRGGAVRGERAWVDE
jgi:hypothetical protein